MTGDTWGLCGRPVRLLANNGIGCDHDSRSLRVELIKHWLNLEAAFLHD
jgi:hypothetical protein